MSGQNVMQIAALELCLITKLLMCWILIPRAVYNLCTALYTCVAASAINT